MRYENNRQTVLSHFVHDDKQLFLFLRCQRSGWLIKHNNPRFRCHALGYLADLLF